MNVHTPERQANETQAQYRQRQRRSKAAVKAMRPQRGGKTTGREDLRDAQRRNGALRGTFGRGLIRAAARKRAEAAPKFGTLRDENGAYTLIGDRANGVGGPPRWMTSNDNGHLGARTVRAGRRIWLAGISAQRGY